ncbi:MAG: signal peptidase I [Eubacterium sp.]|nr:signal peptidase I [Eubacterium sp.]MDD7209875.1 signal peptidase I [Lachnospiraceae bacterium]MDY5497933.1 signal peptidase I [Anaerobutyricum sp.]
MRKKDREKEMKTKGRRMRRRKERRKKAVRDFFGLIAYFLFLCALVYLVLTYVGQRTVVNGDSMDPTLADGQNLIMDKFSYHFSDPKRFDIVIFPGPLEAGEHPYYIKRVIGLPGETVQIKEGKVYINGEELKEDVYGITDYIDEPGIAEEPLTLSDDEYFCLGDNRIVSFDSRYEEVGPVKRQEFVGRVWIRIWPLHLFGKVS